MRAMHVWVVVDLGLIAVVVLLDAGGTPVVVTLGALVGFAAHLALCESFGVATAADVAVVVPAVFAKVLLTNRAVAHLVAVLEVDTATCAGARSMFGVIPLDGLAAIPAGDRIARAVGS